MINHRTIGPAIAAIAMVIAAAPGWTQSSSVYLFEVLRHPGYAQAYDRMFRGSRNVAAWFGSAKQAAAGTTDKGRFVEVDGKNEELYVFCKPHDCAGNSFAVLFSAQGERAVGASVVGGNDRFYGNPTKSEASVLKTAASQ